MVSDSGLTSPRATGLQNGVCNNDRPAFQGIETKKHRQRRLCLHRNNDPPNLPAHFITQREIAEAAPVEYLQKHGF